MFTSIKRLLKKWRASRDGGHQLDALLAIADKTAPYPDRSEWLIELAHWIHRGRAVQPEQLDNTVEDNTSRSSPAHTRIRYLLHVLDRNPAWKANVAGILRALLRESDGLSLLCDAGMPVHSGFFGALFERLEASLIPPAPNRRDLRAIVTLMFSPERDAEWIANLPTDLLTRIRALFDYEQDDSEQRDITPFSLDLLAALHNLTCQISSTGLSQTVRSRLGEVDVRDAGDVRVAMEKQPFYRLTRAMLAVEAAHQAVSAGADS
jgi:site-specific recombinase